MVSQWTHRHSTCKAHARGEHAGTQTLTHLFGLYWTLLDTTALVLHNCHVAWLSRQQGNRQGLPQLSTTLGISVAPLNRNGPHLARGRYGLR